jgi:hypothetical protein
MPPHRSGAPQSPLVLGSRPYGESLPRRAGGTSLCLPLAGLRLRSARELRKSLCVDIGARGVDHRLSQSGGFSPCAAFGFALGRPAVPLNVVAVLLALRQTGRLPALRSGRLPFGARASWAGFARHHASRISPCSVWLSGTECYGNYTVWGYGWGNRNPGIITGTGPGEDWSGVAFLKNMNSETTKIKEIAGLPLDERRKLLEQAAECAVREYETNKELTAFTDHISTLNFFEE